MLNNLFSQNFQTLKRTRTIDPNQTVQIDENIYNDVVEKVPTLEWNQEKVKKDFLESKTLGRLISIDINIQIA